MGEQLYSAYGATLSAGVDHMGVLVEVYESTCDHIFDQSNTLSVNQCLQHVGGTRIVPDECQHTIFHTYLTDTVP